MSTTRDPSAILSTDTRKTAGPQHRWWILAILGMAQLMVVLDATIVNIALPRAQRALGFSNHDRQWVVTAYALAFGALLLLGGRIGDLIGRRTVFLIGLAGFATMSAVGGAAGGFDLLVIARAGQGLFAALLAPAALSLVSTTFTDLKERSLAFAIFGAIAGGGGAIGLLLGGALTEWVSWRWCLYVNVILAVPALIGGAKLLVGGRPAQRVHLDLPGTLTVTAGLFSLVFGFSNAQTHGWSAAATIGWLAAGAVAIVIFVGIESRVAHPLLPLRIVRDRNRGGSLIALLVAGAGLFAVFLFLTFYLQVSLGYSPIRTGLAFLPMIAGLAAMAQVASRFLPRTGPRPIVPVGMVLAVGGMLLLTRLQLDSGYVRTILPALLVTGFGLGLVIAPSIQGAVSGIEPADAGVGSAMASTMQQIGGSIGTAVFSTLAATATVNYLHSHTGSSVAAQAALEGYLTVFKWAAAIFAVGFVVTALLLRSGAPRPSAPADASAPIESQSVAISAEEAADDGVDVLPASADTVIEDEALLRLASVLLPDPDRAVQAVTAADRALVDLRRLGHEFEVRAAEYDQFLNTLRTLGMSDDQITNLLDGPVPHPGRHSELHNEAGAPGVSRIHVGRTHSVR